MEWNKENTIELINTYKKHRILWDLNDPQHYNKTNKQDAWEMVGKELQRSVEECKRKMEYLLAAMRREKMKKTKSSRMGTGTYKSSWFAYKSLLFLWEKNKHRQTLHNSPNKLREDQKHQTLDEPQIKPAATLVKETSEVYQDTSAPTKRRLTVTISPSSQKHKKSLKFNGPNSTPSASVASSIVPPSSDDSYYFGNFVGAKLREYDHKTRFSLQMDIMDIFARANNGYYTTNSFNHRYSTSPICSESNPNFLFAQRNTRSANESLQSSPNATPCFNDIGDDSNSRDVDMEP